jgi:DNA-directed RNA polymerase subunit RPC12/RpoP
MAVKVVEKPPVELPQNINCPHCGAKLTYKKSDVTHQDAKDFYACGDGWQEWIECPSCDKRVIVAEDKGTAEGMLKSFRPGTPQ